ncbi:MAG: metallophosphoesterase [Bacteroidales bacterium]|nr:metallophosphoesterase [Bacteroidales bacterium]
MKKFAIIFLLVAGAGFSACEKFEYNVYETNRTKKDIKVTTEYNIERLLRLSHKDTLHLVFTGDTQQFDDNLEDLVEVINDLPALDAVIITGDIAEYGTAHEYKLINEQFKLLKVPFITVIGNHDCLANGPELYKDIYGPLNYSFTWNNIRFVAHNTNSREFNFNGTVPDLNWMQQQLADTANYQCCIFVSHIPPFNTSFDKVLEPGYTKLIREAKNTIFSSNGHRHDYSLDQPYNDGIWYLNTSSPPNRIYCYVTIYPYASQSKKFDCVPVHF